MSFICSKIINSSCRIEDPDLIDAWCQNCLRTEVKRLQSQLAAIDMVLARRPALETITSRYVKIEHACSMAGKADRLERELAALKIANEGHRTVSFW